MLTRLVLLSLFIFCSPCISQAASFDCAKAGSPMEKAICSDPQLSKADEDLQKAYEAALKPLSENGQTATRDSQRAWLAAVKKVCHPDGDKEILVTGKTADASCIMELYKDRLKQLNTASPKVGPFQFYKISHFKVNHARKDWRGTQDFLLQEYVTFRIDNPKNDAQKSWNKYMSLLPQNSICEESGEHSETSRVEGAGENYISIMTSFGDYCGGAHGSGGNYAITRVLTPSRAAIASDIFDTASDWKQKLGEATMASIYDIPEDERPSGKIDDETLQAIPETVADDADRGSVSIKEKGLGIYFRGYEFGTYLDGIPKEVVIPWDKLKPILNPNSPIKLPLRN